MLGLCYELGRGVDEDKARAVALYRQAAEQGDARSQCNLGYCYYRGIGVDEDNGDRRGGVVCQVRPPGPPQGHKPAGGVL